MVVISISKKLAQEANISTADNYLIEPNYYVHTVEMENNLLALIIRTDTYFSYTTVLNGNTEMNFKQLLKKKIGTQSIQFVITVNKSSLSKVSSIGKKYKELINRCRANTIILSEIEDLANKIPWKFLDFKSPSELELLSKKL